MPYNPNADLAMNQGASVANKKKMKLARPPGFKQPPKAFKQPPQATPPNFGGKDMFQTNGDASVSKPVRPPKEDPTIRNLIGTLPSDWKLPVNTWKPNPSPEPPISPNPVKQNPMMPPNMELAAFALPPDQQMPYEPDRGNPDFSKFGPYFPDAGTGSGVSPDSDGAVDNGGGIYAPNVKYNGPPIPMQNPISQIQNPDQDQMANVLSSMNLPQRFQGNAQRAMRFIQNSPKSKLAQLFNQRRFGLGAGG